MSKNYDLVIIGGGPAGVTAGIYAARQNLKTLVITKNFGGQIAKKAVGIENYPGFKKIQGMELVERFEKHLKQFEIDIVKSSVGNVEKKDNLFIISDNKKNCFKSRAVIVATGADPRPLEVSGEKEYIGKGVSYCSVCDGPLFKDKVVAVIGAGNAGVESALFLSNFAKKIYILEFLKESPADKVLQEEVGRNNKIELIFRADLKKIEGEKFVKSILWRDKESGKEKSLQVDGIFVEIGSQPATSFVKNLVDFSEKDEIEIDPQTCQTKTPGLFAAGDVSNVYYKQIVIAAGQGAISALSAYKYLNKK